MKILVTNDDGVHAPGIKALTQAMQEFAEVVVVAPDRDRSGASNSLTLHKPLRLVKLSDTIYCVDGTPSDTVHIALTGALDFKPDLVVSGINHGANLGDDVLYSGTVAAALEARMLGFPAIAFSLSGELPLKMDTAAHVAKCVVNCFNQTPLPSNSLINVNIPAVEIDELRGFDITRTGRRHPAGEIVRHIDPRGKEVFWIGCVGEKSDAGEGTDFHAVEHNKISITPLQVDITHYPSFDAIVNWSSKLTGIKF